MISPHQNFINIADNNIRNDRHNRVISVLNGKNNSDKNTLTQFIDLDTAKKRAAQIKWKTHAKLDEYLIEFEANFIKNGGKVIWAVDAADALSSISRILKNADADLVIKSKSVSTDEIKLKDALKANKIECVESDLGDFIQQKSNEASFHIVMPALHKSFDEIRNVFSENYPGDKTESPEALVALVRNIMKTKFMSANAGITGANFLIADTGSVSITENEGNAILTASCPKIHIVIAGIEKVIPSLTDLSLFLPLLSSHGTNQTLTALNSIISGPRKSNESDGPDEMYVILLDNGRTEILESTEQRQALSCIRCGACLNVCPVYKFSGGHAYGTEAMGPIGSVLMPHKYNLLDFKHLSYASTLCGKCTDVCPMKIDLHKLILFTRRDIVDSKLGSRKEKFMFYIWKKTMLNRKKMNKGSLSKKLILNNFFKKAWGSDRSFPKPAKTSFNELWRKKFPELDK